MPAPGKQAKERKAWCEARDRQQRALMYPSGDEAQEKRLALEKQIQALPIERPAVRVTASTRWE